MKTTLRLILAVTLAPLAAGSALAQPGHDKRFIEEAIRGDNSEIMLGSVAAKRGVSGDLRAFGATLRDDHARAKSLMEPLARRNGVAMDQGPMPEDRGAP